MKATLVQCSPNFCFQLLSGDRRYRSENRHVLCFVQNDWDYPGLATICGWSLKDLQICRNCKKPITFRKNQTEVKCEECDHKNVLCEHGGTDGTVYCRECGATAGAFMSAAYDFLSENDGKRVELD